MGTATGFHTDQARRQRGHQLERLVAPNRLVQHWMTVRVDAVHREDRLCEIDANGSNLLHDFPSGFRLNFDTSILAPGCRHRDGEVPIIR
jgi:hypothetical protein